MRLNFLKRGHPHTSNLQASIIRSFEPVKAMNF